MLTRRCSERRFFLRPGAKTNQIFNYCLASAAQRTGVKIIAYAVMSNHYHAIVCDTQGLLPDFMEHLNKFVARLLNVLWKRTGSVWAPGSYCGTHLVQPSDVMDKIVYTLGNPVASDLVDRVTDWPGACSYDSMLSGEPLHTSRPNLFFREEGVTPKEVNLVLARPPGYELLSQEAWAAELRERIKIKEDLARSVRVAKGKQILGREAVLETNPFDSPATYERRGKLRPAVACKDRVLRIRTLQNLKAFRLAHEEARLQLKAKTLDVVFPYGTYRMRLMGHLCAGPP